MTPGTVLCDREFQFKDGDTGKKLLVVLGGGLPNHYVIILTTSKQKTKGRQEGCQPKDRLHNYFLPEGSCCLSGDSWLLLNSVYNFEAEKLLARSLSGFISHIGLKWLGVTDAQGKTHGKHKLRDWTPAASRDQSGELLQWAVKRGVRITIQFGSWSGAVNDGNFLRCLIADRYPVRVFNLAENDARAETIAFCAAMLAI